MVEKGKDSVLTVQRDRGKKGGKEGVKISSFCRTERQKKGRARLPYYHSVSGEKKKRIKGNPFISGKYSPEGERKKERGKLLTYSSVFLIGEERKGSYRFASIFHSALRGKKEKGKMEGTAHPSHPEIGETRKRERKRF